MKPITLEDKLAGQACKIGSVEEAEADINKTIVDLEDILSEGLYGKKIVYYENMANASRPSIPFWKGSVEPIKINEFTALAVFIGVSLMIAGVAQHLKAGKSTNHELISIMAAIAGMLIGVWSSKIKY